MPHSSIWTCLLTSTSAFLIISTITTTASALPTVTSTKPSISPATTTTTFQTPSQPLLNTHCHSTADCHTNVTTFSRCYLGQCICSLGYQVIGRSCIKVACIFNSDCSGLFPNSACDAGSGRCVCDYFHSLNVLSQTCSEVNGLNWAIFLVFAGFLFGSVAFILGVFFKVTVCDEVVGLIRRRKSGYSGIN